MVKPTVEHGENIGKEFFAAMHSQVPADGWCSVIVGTKLSNDCNNETRYLITVGPNNRAKSKWRIQCHPIAKI